jgi:phage gp45-like
MTSFRAYVSGGARGVAGKVDDTKLMQEVTANVMKGETRQGIEAPQNYGFTSVHMGPDQDSQGNLTGGAEHFMSFMGGNRSFPVAGVIDDRRHRLNSMDEGDVAMYRTNQDSQQFHLTKDGGFWSGPTNKTVRMQLVDQQQQQQQQSGSTSGGSSGGGQQQKGQKPVYKNGQNSHRFVDVTQDKTRVSGNEAHLMLSDGDSYVHCLNQQTYLGGRQDKHKFAPVITTSGPSVNVYGRIG